MKIICIGRNYHDHVKELNNELPEAPVFFLKPDTALIPKNLPFFIPKFSQNIHFETEIVFRICKVGKHISEKFANTYYDAVGIGIDFTARDIQEECKSKGLPWEICKAFDFSAPVSSFVSKNTFSDINNLNFSLLKNGQQVQNGNTSQMIFNIDKIISHVSKYITIKTGDMIFTGTPAGVGPVAVDDILEAYMEQKKMLTIKIK
jgi:acylpyruvate hydrolase